ncbi:MAG: Hpt domain-containing protein [Candidatus Magnetomorum sp.]|nr:Hpt domain-containing protein [Candidatus Magnetomorum sp.]
MMIDADTLNTYFEESNCSLKDIEKDLITLEDMGAKIDIPFAGEIFRSMHAIKSGASILGLSKIKELSQKLENILGLICNEKLVPNPEVINLLLQGCDRLLQLTRQQYTQKEIDIDEQSVMLTGLTSAVLPDDKKDSVTHIRNIPLPDGRHAFQIPEFNIQQALDQGKTVYILEYDLIRDVQEKNDTPLNMVRFVQQHGEMIDSLLDIKSVGTLEENISLPGIPYFILLASSLTHEQLVTALNISPHKVYELKNEFDDLVNPQNNKCLKKHCFQNNSIQKQECPLSLLNQEQLERFSGLASELNFAYDYLLNTNMAEDPIKDIAINRIKVVLTDFQALVDAGQKTPVSKGSLELIRNIRDYGFQSGNKARINCSGEDILMDRRILRQLVDALTGSIIKMILFFSRIRENSGQKKAITQFTLTIVENEQNVILELFSPDRMPIPENSFLDIHLEQNQLNSINSELQQNQQPEKGIVLTFTLPRTFTILNGYPVEIDHQTYIIPRINVLGYSLRSELSENTDLRQTGDHMIILYENQWIPIISIYREASQHTINAVLHRNVFVFCHIGTQRFGLAVDKAEESETDAVLQPLSRHLSSNPTLVGTCLLKDGDIAFVPDMGYFAYQAMLTKC